MPDLPGGPSEAARAIARAEAAIRADERAKVVREYIDNAEPKVAATVRIDQTKRIADWLASRRGTSGRFGQYGHRFAADVLREFGGGSNAD